MALQSQLIVAFLQGLFDDDELGDELRQDDDDDDEDEDDDDDADEPAPPSASKRKPAPSKRKVDRKDVRCGGADTLSPAHTAQRSAGRQARQGDDPVRKGTRARAAQGRARVLVM